MNISLYTAASQPPPVVSSSTPTTKNQSRGHLWAKFTLRRTAEVENGGYQWVTEKS